MTGQRIYTRNIHTLVDRYGFSLPTAVLLQHEVRHDERIYLNIADVVAHVKSKRTQPVEQEEAERKKYKKTALGGPRQLYG